MQSAARRRRFALVALTTALAALTLLHQVDTVAGGVVVEKRSIASFEDEDSYYGCDPAKCEDPVGDSFFSYHACCSDECCHKFRFWVIPAGIASVGFVAGAFFALCFQCRD